MQKILKNLSARLHRQRAMCTGYLPCSSQKSQTATSAEEKKQTLVVCHKQCLNQTPVPWERGMMFLGKNPVADLEGQTLPYGLGGLKEISVFISVQYLEFEKQKESFNYKMSLTKLSLIVSTKVWMRKTLGDY